jgi:hypothetical protein
VNGHIKAVEAYTNAFIKADDVSAGAASQFLADDIVVLTNFGDAEGKQATEELFKNSRTGALLVGASWSDPIVDGDLVVVTATLAETMSIGGIEFAFQFIDGKIARVEQQILPAVPLEPLELCLTDDMRNAIKGALDNQTPMMLAYCDHHEQIHLSFRGTVQAYSDHQLALWARDPGAGFPQNVVLRPDVTLFYHDPAGRTTYTFYGKAHIVSDETVRLTIFDNSDPRERHMDYRRRGVAIIVDLTQVEGRSPRGRVRMARTR